MDLPDSGIKLGSPALQADSLPAELSGSSSKCILKFSYVIKKLTIIYHKEFRDGMSANKQKFSVLAPLFLGFSSAFLHLQAGSNLASVFSISIFNLDYA